MILALHMIGAVLAAVGCSGLIILAMAMQASPHSPWAIGDRLWALGSTVFLAVGAALCIFI